MHDRWDRNTDKSRPLITSSRPIACVPFGGRKKSSYAPREQGLVCQGLYTIVKTAYVAP